MILNLDNVKKVINWLRTAQETQVFCCYCGPVDPLDEDMTIGYCATGIIGKRLELPVKPGMKYYENQIVHNRLLSWLSDGHNTHDAATLVADIQKWNDSHELPFRKIADYIDTTIIKSRTPINDTPTATTEETGTETLST